MTSVENVLLVVVDALRPDRLGAYTNRDITPTIDAIAAEGEVFEACYACTNATDPSVTTILSGLYPTSHGVINHGKRVTDKELEYAADVTTIAGYLQQSHETIAVDILDRWHAQEFDHYNDGQQASRSAVTTLLEAIPSRVSVLINRGISRIMPSKIPTPAVEAPQVANTLISTLEETTSQWFALAHFWDTHAPYIPMNRHPDAVRGRTYADDDIPLGDRMETIKGGEWHSKLLNELTGEAETVGDMKRKYDAGLWTVDKQLGRIVDYLKQTGQYEETAIVITGDHGESFTEHNVFFDHHTLYDESVHVPLIINAPKFNGRESAFVQHFDIAPTVLDLLGSNVDESLFDGVSLVPENDDRALDRDAVYFEEAYTARRRAIRTNEYKFITRLDEGQPCKYCDRHHATGDELYDLQDDPHEQENCIQTHPEVANELATSLAAWVERRSDPSRMETDLGANETVERRLQEMGYL